MTKSWLDYYKDHVIIHISSVKRIKPTLQKLEIKYELVSEYCRYERIMININDLNLLRLTGGNFEFINKPNYFVSDYSSYRHFWIDN